MDLENLVWRKQTGDYSKTFYAIALIFPKLIQCLKITWYIKFHNSEFNFFLIISPFRLRKSSLKAKTCDNSKTISGIALKLHKLN